MAEAAVSFAVKTIGKLLIDEGEFLGAVRDEVLELCRELRLIRCLLRDADARREHNEAVGECVAQVRDFAYDAEDIIERYILRVAPKEEQNIIRKYACFVANCTCLQVHVVRTEIERLKSRISSIRNTMQACGLQPVNEVEDEHATFYRPKQTDGHFEEVIIGREESIEVLVKELLNGKQSRAIFICGMVGLGKTILARIVLNHDLVKMNFKGFAWANISKKYHMRDILVGILVKLIPGQKKRFMKMIDDELFETLHKIQQENRCLVVLDNIRTKEDWDRLQAAFPYKNRRSKLLITTRNIEVAMYIDPDGFFLEPRCLTNEQSWQLLKKSLVVHISSVGPGVSQNIAAGQEVKGTARQSETDLLPVITENMKRLGHNLLQKCGGLPLAVIVIGGLLAINEWETIYRKINLHFDDKSDVSKLLALSYDDLPWHLKQCFLYLSIFPEDAEIHAMEVLQMWIAEGFVLPNAYDKERGILAEDIAEHYLKELVTRGLVQVQFNLSGRIKSCHLNEIMRDLCVSMAKRERFLGILNIQADNEIEECSSLMSIESVYKARRLSLNLRSSAERNMIELIGRSMSQLRTLMFFESIKGKWNQFQSIFINCKFLRVLKFENFYFMGGSLPKFVGNLVHLRLLSLKGSIFEGLPQSMGNLLCMEFLDLRVDSCVVVTVPNVLWKMKRLRHLHLPYHFVVKEKFCGDQKKLRLDTLENLHTLRNFGSNNCEVNDVGKLISLRKLTFLEQYGSNELEIIAKLAQFSLRFLQTSSFKFFSLSFTEGDLSKMSSYPYSCKMLLRGMIERLPEHKSLPQLLRKLVLIYSFLKEDPMPVLEKLNHLVVLLLGNCAFVGKEMICSAGGFPQLKQLVFDGLPYLEEWRVVEGAFPRLPGGRLGISSCPNLKSVPKGFSSAYDGGKHMADEYWK